MSNLINLTLRLGLLTPLHPAAQTPPPPPPPVVVVAPAPVAAAPVTSAPSVAAPAPAAPTPAVTTTPVTTVYNGTECVVSITDNLGNVMAFSPGPADSNGTCAAYPASDYSAPGNTVSVSAQSVTITYG